MNPRVYTRHNLPADRIARALFQHFGIHRATRPCFFLSGISETRPRLLARRHFHAFTRDVRAGRFAHDRTHGRARFPASTRPRIFPLSPPVRVEDSFQKWIDIRYSVSTSITFISPSSECISEFPTFSIRYRGAKVIIYEFAVAFALISPVWERGRADCRKLSFQHIPARRD